MMRLRACGDVETGLTALHLHIAPSLLLEVEQHLAEEVLEILEGARERVAVADKARITDVERGAECVGRLGRGIAVDTPQTADSGGSAQQAGHFQAVGPPRLVRPANR